MNIFYLDPDPRTCAAMHCDRHVVKMMQEYLQILCTVAHLKGCWADGMYRPTHAHNPCVGWAAGSPDAAVWLLRLARHVQLQYTFRYRKISEPASRVFALVHAAFGSPPLNIPGGPACGDPPKVIAKNLLPHEGSVVEAYRLFYHTDKARFCTWRNGAPHWWKESSNAG